MTISVRVSTLVGPALTTAAALRFGATSTLCVIAALWILAALLPTWPKRDIAKAPKERLTLSRFAADLRDGLDEARRHP